MKKISLCLLIVSACNIKPKMTEQERIDSIATQQRHTIDSVVSQYDSIRKACIYTLEETDSVVGASKPNDPEVSRALARAKIARKTLDSINIVLRHK
jgi:hypothetical protein